MDTSPNETVNDAIDRAAMPVSLLAPLRGGGSRFYAFARSSARFRLCLRVRASRQGSPVSEDLAWGYLRRAPKTFGKKTSRHSRQRDKAPIGKECPVRGEHVHVREATVNEFL